MTRRERNQVIEAVAGQIYDLDIINASCGEDITMAEEAAERNREGWSMDLRLDGREYTDANSYTRIEGVVLSPAELARAVAMAETWLDEVAS